MEEYAAKYQKQHRNLCGEVSLVFKTVIDFLIYIKGDLL